MKKEARPQESWMFLGITFFFLFCVPVKISFAQFHVDLAPSISVEQQYYDNIYFDSGKDKIIKAEDEDSDYLTLVSPGLRLNMLSQNTDLKLQYTPTFVRYAQDDQNDTTRHFGTLAFRQNLREHLRFDFTNTYRRSEEPREETEDIEGVRRTRDTYQRNFGRVGLSYVFGTENALTAGYVHRLLENEEDLDANDSTDQKPFATVGYSFDVKNRVELDYGYRKVEFSIDDEPPAVFDEARDDYTGHEGGIRYIYSFTPHTTGSLGYRLTTRNFDILVYEPLPGVFFARSQDYNVHEGSIGFGHAFFSDLSVSAAAGYFLQEYKHEDKNIQGQQQDDQSGLVYDALLKKQFDRGRITVGGKGGWYEAYQEAERRGFSRYWRADTKLEYQLLEPLEFYAECSYRSDKRDEDSRKWDSVRGNCGLTWAFMRWFSLSLDYKYFYRDDDVDTSDYTVNRVALILKASRLYRW